MNTKLPELPKPDPRKLPTIRYDKHRLTDKPYKLVQSQQRMCAYSCKCYYGYHVILILEMLLNGKE